MEKLIISMMRFSTAVTLFGMEQLESAMSMGGTQDISNTMERFRHSLDSFTDMLSKEIDPRKREALKSVTNMSEEAVHRTMEGMSSVDPREMMRTTSDLLRKTSDSVAEMVTRGAKTAGKAIEATEPETAANALSSKRKHSR